MKFPKEKKQSIIYYILEKIDEGCKSVSKTVSEKLGINQTTVHAYINELVEKEVILRAHRGEYVLKKQRADYQLSRNNGDLASDTYAFHYCLEPHLKSFSQNVQTIWSYAFTEMINNVMDHSDAENVVISIEQDYLKTSVWIDDNGIGIFKKIKDHFQLESLDEAICELFKGKLTTDSENHSGEGIFFTSKLMDDFMILSDEKLFAKNRFDDTKVFTVETHWNSGTCVYMSLSNQTHKTTKEIFDTFSDIDGGFWKTKIPLKNFFGPAPVSRSQAKRVCSRLDNFEEVELDFEGLEWIGQGFAHQIFVVFQKECPQVRLIPINMSPAVEKMYKHVLNS